MKHQLILFLGLFAFSATASNIQELSQNKEFNWETIKKVNEVSSFQVTGTVIAEEGALHIQSARVSGRVLSLVNEEGGIVKRGSPLFAITGPECTTLREEKRIALKSKLEELVTSMSQREHELNIRLTNNECLVLADATGILVKRSIGSGNSFNQGDVLAQILEPEKMQVEIEVPERTASSITRGSPVTFRLPSAPAFKGTSQVHQVFPVVEEGSRMMRARLNKAPLPPGTKLNSMVFATIELPQNKQCLSVPETSVTFQDNKAWVLKRGSTLERIPVDVIGSSGSQLLVSATIQSHLQDGDTVATFNVPFLFQELKKLQPVRR